MVRADKVLGPGKRGWFCSRCAWNGGRLSLADGAPAEPDLASLLFASLVFNEHGRDHDWLSCREHADCADLLAYCEEKHDRYGEILFPRELGRMTD